MLKLKEKLDSWFWPIYFDFLPRYSPPKVTSSYAPVFFLNFCTGRRVLYHLFLQIIKMDWIAMFSFKWFYIFCNITVCCIASIDYSSGFKVWKLPQINQRTTLHRPCCLSASMYLHFFAFFIWGLVSMSTTHSTRETEACHLDSHFSSIIQSYDSYVVLQALSFLHRFLISAFLSLPFWMFDSGDLKQTPFCYKVFSQSVMAGQENVLVKCFNNVSLFSMWS